MTGEEAGAAGEASAEHEGDTTAGWYEGYTWQPGMCFALTKEVSLKCSNAFESLGEETKKPPRKRRKMKRVKKWTAVLPTIVENVCSRDTFLTMEMIETYARRHGLVLSHAEEEMLEDLEMMSDEHFENIVRSGRNPFEIDGLSLANIDCEKRGKDIDESMPTDIDCGEAMRFGSVRYEDYKARSPRIDDVTTDNVDCEKCEKGCEKNNTTSESSDDSAEIERKPRIDEATTDNVDCDKGCEKNDITSESTRDNAECERKLQGVWKRRVSLKARPTATARKSCERE